MTRTTAYASRMYGDPDAAIPCEFEDGALVPARQRKTDRTMHAAGGLGASIHDLGRWLRLNVDRGTIDGQRILSSASTEEMWNTQAPMKKPMSMGLRTRDGYGFGWAVGPYNNDTRMLDHGG